MTATKWGYCDRCGKPSECRRYEVENPDGGYRFCEPCFESYERELLVAFRKWFHESQQLRRGSSDA